MRFVLTIVALIAGLAVASPIASPDGNILEARDGECCACPAPRRGGSGEPKAKTSTPKCCACPRRPDGGEPRVSSSSLNAGGDDFDFFKVNSSP